MHRHLMHMIIYLKNRMLTVEGGETAHAFRLHKINEILKILEAERDKRSSLAKKYQRGINVLTGIILRM
jgi:hypothetical protein